MHQHNNEIYVKLIYEKKDYFIQAPTQENIKAKHNKKHIYVMKKRWREKAKIIGSSLLTYILFYFFNLCSVQCNRDSNNKRLIMQMRKHKHYKYVLL